MTSSYKRLLALAKSKGHYKGYEPKSEEIPAPTKLKFYKRRLVIVQRRLAYYRPMKLNYLQVQLVSTLRMFEDELKRRITEWKITKQ